MRQMRGGVEGAQECRHTHTHTHKSGWSIITQPHRKSETMEDSRVLNSQVRAQRTKGGEQWTSTPASERTFQPVFCSQSNPPPLRTEHGCF